MAVAAAVAGVVALAAAVGLLWPKPKPAPQPETRIQELVFSGTIEPAEALILVNGRSVGLDRNKSARIEPALDPQAALSVVVSPPSGYEGSPVAVAPADPKPDATGRLVIARDVTFAKRTVRLLAFVGTISPPNVLVEVNKQSPVPLVEGQCKPETPIAYGEEVEVRILPPPGFAGKPVIPLVRGTRPGEDGRLTVNANVRFERATGSLTVVGMHDHTHAEALWLRPLDAEREPLERAGEKAPGPRQVAFNQNKAVFAALPTGVYKVTLRSPDNNKAVPPRPLPQEWLVAADGNQEVPAPKGWSGTWQARYVYIDKGDGAETRYTVACTLVFEPGLAGGEMTETFTRQRDNQLTDQVQCPIDNIEVSPDGSLRARIRSEKGPGTFDDALAITRDPAQAGQFRMVRVPDPKYGGKFEGYKVDEPVGRAD